MTPNETTEHTEGGRKGKLVICGVKDGGTDSLWVCT